MANNLTTAFTVLAGGAGPSARIDLRLVDGPLTVRYVGAVGDKIQVSVSHSTTGFVADIERTVQTVDDGELCFIVTVLDQLTGQPVPVDYNYAVIEVLSGNTGATATASVTGQPRTTYKPTSTLTVNNNTTPGAYADCRTLGGPRTIFYKGFAGDSIYLEGSDDGATNPYTVYPASGTTVRTGSSWAAVVEKIPNYLRIVRPAGTTAGAECGIMGSDNTPGGGGGGSGPLVLDEVDVGNTAVSGPIGALTAAQTVDIAAALRATQTTASVAATLEAPTINNCKLETVINRTAATQPLSMYGQLIYPGYFSLFAYEGAAWCPLGYVGPGGNSFAFDIQIGSINSQNVSFIRANREIVRLDGTNVVLLPEGVGAGQTGAIALRELATNGTNQVRLRAPDALAADVELIAPTAQATAGASSVVTNDGAGQLGFLQFQIGTSSIGAAGVSAAIAANITASSRIFCFVKDFVASTAVGLEAKAADRAVGAPGSFIVTAYDAAGAAVAGANGTTFDWMVVG